jgi:excisionase family DNA binding protein
MQPMCDDWLSVKQRRTVMQPHSQRQNKADAPIKAGWRIREWCSEVGVGRSHVYDLLNAKKIRAVKSGKATIIVTPPADYLAGLPAV